MTETDEQELALMGRVDQNSEVHRDSSDEDQDVLRGLYGEPVQGYFTGVGEGGA